MRFMIEKLDQETLRPALQLVRRVFDVFEAPDYSKQGVSTFYDFIAYDNIIKIFPKEGYQFWGAFDGLNVIGMIATRDSNHLSLFFVDSDYQRQGIGRTLFSVVTEELKGKGIHDMTVNSSPYAEPVYARLGFHKTDSEQLVDGLRFIPMVYKEEEK